MWKIHLENKEPPAPIIIAGHVLSTRIGIETPPIAIVDTQEEAKQVMQELIARGVPRLDLYAVGF